MRLRLWRLDFPWSLSIAVLAIAVTVLTQLGLLGALAATREGVLHGEAWRVVTGTLVHSNYGHLGRDVVAFLLLGAAYEPSLARRRWLTLLVPALVVPVVVSLTTQPQLPAYFGLSGAVYALIAAAFIIEWRETGGHPPKWIVGFSTVTVLKLIYETVTGQLLIPMELGVGVVPVPVAHIAGLLVGALAMLGSPGRPEKGDQRRDLLRGGAHPVHQFASRDDPRSPRAGRRGASGAPVCESR